MPRLKVKRAREVEPHSASAETGLEQKFLLQSISLKLFFPFENALVSVLASSVWACAPV